MMKRSLVFFLVTALVLVSSSAFAERQTFSGVGVTIDVPNGWTATEVATAADWTREGISGREVYLQKTDTNSFMYVYVGSKAASGTNERLMDIANKFVRLLADSTSTLSDSTLGYYQFDYTQSGNVSARARIFDQNTKADMGINDYCVIRWSTTDNDAVTHVNDMYATIGFLGSRTNGNTVGGGSGGGGCNSGAGIFALLVLASSFKSLRKKQ